MTTCLTTRRTAAQRGFTLIESLMACGILLVTVIAVTSAVTTGQQHAFYAHQRIAGTLAAEELMSRLETLDYESLVIGHQVEPVGTLTDAQNLGFPESFETVGREVWIAQVDEDVDNLGVTVRGRLIRVRSFDDNDHTLADVARFIAEPAEYSIPEAETSGGGTEGGGDGGVIGGLLRGLFGW